MKITIKELLNEKTWLNVELLKSLTKEVIDSAIEQEFYEVKFIVNGQDVEPLMFSEIMNGIEKYIEQEANSIIQEKLGKAMQEAENLSNVVSEAVEKISDKYNL